MKSLTNYNMTNKETKQPTLKFDMELAYRAAATAMSFIAFTGESFVIRELELRNDDVDFVYCFPKNQENTDSREGLAQISEIIGTITGHALYTGEILSSRDLGIYDKNCIESLDKTAKIHLDMCQNTYLNFIQDVAKILSKRGKICGHQIEDIFLKYFDGEIIETEDVEYRKFK